METNINIQHIYDEIYSAIQIGEKGCPGVFFYETVDSTNDRLHNLAESDADEGSVIVSYCQTNGHGRSGRSFYSPKGGNVYMSILLRPENMESISMYTPAAAVAVARAIRKMTGIDVSIKWVNDIFLNDRKICGILASAYGFERNSPYIILGIGINVFVKQEEVPEEIRDIYGALLGNQNYDEKDDFLPRLSAGIYEEYMKIYYKLPDNDFMNEYRKKSNLIGKAAYYMSGDTTVSVRVLDIDNDGAIVLIHEDGTTKKYKDGEIRIKIV